MKSVIKRDGTIEPWQTLKIVQALKNANSDSPINVSEKEIKTIANCIKVVMEIAESYIEAPHIKIERIDETVKLFLQTYHLSLHKEYVRYSDSKK